MIEAGLHRVPDADPDRVLARGRARLPGAGAAASRQVLRAAAGAAAVQAAADGRRASTAISRSRPASATRRAARTARPGEFYQLDFEMSFVTQEDVFATIEPVIAGVFEEFAGGRAVDAGRRSRAFPTTRRCWNTAPTSPTCAIRCAITDVTEHFAGSGFGLFARIAASGGVVRAIPAPGAAGQPRSFFDKLNEWARERGRRRARLHHLRRRRRRRGRSRATWSRRAPRRSAAACGLQRGRRGVLRRRQEGRGAEIRRRGAHAGSGQDLGLIEQGAFRFCWITDFPMYELNEETGQIDFSHNPFTMPQGGHGGAEHAGPADHQGVPVRHRLQRHRAVLGRDPQPSAGHHDPGLRDRRLQRRGGGGAVRRHAERVPLRRAAAWRLGAGHRPHRHAAGRRAEYPRGHPVPAEPAGRGPDDGRAGRGAAGAAEGAVASGSICRRRRGRRPSRILASCCCTSCWRAIRALASSGLHSYVPWRTQLMRGVQRMRLLPLPLLAAMLAPPAPAGAGRRRGTVAATDLAAPSRALHADAGQRPRRRRRRRDRRHGLRGGRRLRRLGGPPAAGHDGHQHRWPGHPHGLRLRHLGIQGRAEVALPHAADHRFRGDRQTDGDATLQRRAARARCITPCPKDTTVALPAGTLFPMAHTEAIIAAAARARSSSRCRCSTAPTRTGRGQLDRHPRLEAARGPTQVAGAGRACPARGSAWRSSIASRTAITPDYEVGMRYWENGVADDLQMDFGDFIMRGALAKLTLLKPGC